MRASLKTIGKRIVGNRWEVRRTIWPFPDGWGTYNPWTNTILDTGLEKEEATKRCEVLNAS